MFKEKNRIIYSIESIFLENIPNMDKEHEGTNENARRNFLKIGLVGAEILAE